jgi:hypothetical protein
VAFPRSNHALDVARIGREGENGVLNIARSDAELHGEGEEMNQLLAGMADEVCAENALT